MQGVDRERGGGGEQRRVRGNVGGTVAGDDEALVAGPVDAGDREQIAGAIPVRGVLGAQVHLETVGGAIAVVRLARVLPDLVLHGVDGAEVGLLVGGGAAAERGGLVVEGH